MKDFLRRWTNNGHQHPFEEMYSWVHVKYENNGFPKSCRCKHTAVMLLNFGLNSDVTPTLFIPMKP